MALLEAFNTLYPYEGDYIQGGHNGYIVFQLPSGRAAFVFGGPYMARPSDKFGVKMAEEINLPFDVSVPTEDYSVPNVEQLRRGLIKTMVAMHKGEAIYVGCLGGIGRTGLFIACLVKVMYPHLEPVQFTRLEYLSHAVETKQQMDYVEKLNVDDIRDLVRLM